MPLLESEECDIWWILSMYSLLRVSLYENNKFNFICKYIRNQLIFYVGGNGMITDNVQANSLILLLNYKKFGITKAEEI